MTTVVNLYKTPDFDVYIGRKGLGQDGYFGNPFIMAKDNTPEARDSVLASYRTYFYSRIEKDPEFKKRVLSLKDKRLGCFCHPKACHGDIIAEWLDGVNIEMGKGD